MKIGEARGEAPEPSQPKGRLKRALTTALITSGGITMGEALAHVIARKVLKNPPTSQGVQRAKIILPILSGAAVVLGDELRRMREDRINKGDKKEVRAR